jgi:hypothetical protein
MEVDVDHQLVENAAGGFGGTGQIDARRRTITLAGHEFYLLSGKASGGELALPPLAVSRSPGEARAYLGVTTAVL